MGGGYVGFGESLLRFWILMFRICVVYLFLVVIVLKFVGDRLCSSL